MKKSLLATKSLTSLAAILCFLFVPGAVSAQTRARLNQVTTLAKSNDEAKAMAMLKRLEDQVIVYRSMGEWEDGRRLARVPLPTFERELREVTLELQPLVSEMPAGKFRDEITNALASYRDGLFWWRKIDQPRVVTVSTLAYARRDVTPADAAFTSTIPYTVAIHWRQAARYLAQAENTLVRR
jgi:hypothetical protein